MSENELPTPIKSLLWEYRGNVSLKANPELIIERVLDHGSLENIRWLFAHVPKEKISAVVINSTNLDPKTATFWALKLGITEPLACLKKRSPQKPNKLWKF